MKVVKSHVPGRTTPLQLQVQRTPKQISRKQPSRRSNRRVTQRFCVAQQQQYTPPQQAPGSRSARQRKGNQVGEGSKDVVAAARHKSMPPLQGTLQADQPGQLTSFFGKCVAAYRIFFPQQAPQQTAQEQGRNRLRMILVADRCAMSNSTLTDMKSSIVSAVSNYVEVATDDRVEVNVTTDSDMGTIYSVAVPVKRVKPSARFDIRDHLQDGMAVTEWSEDDPEADPSARFPYGT